MCVAATSTALRNRRPRDTRDEMIRPFSWDFRAALTLLLRVSALTSQGLGERQPRFIDVSHELTE
jgi:hypothetical protein